MKYTFPIALIIVAIIVFILLGTTKEGLLLTGYCAGFAVADFLNKKFITK